MNVFFFGDSICFGQFVSPHSSWVSRLSRSLEERFPHLGLRVMNPSVSGNTTRMALERMPFDVQSHGVNFILIQFGLNDCNCWETDRGLPRVAPAAFAANIQEMVDRAIAFGSRRIFLNTNHPTSRTEPFSHVDLVYQKQNERYNEILRGIADNEENRESVRLIDVEKGWFEKLEGGADLGPLLEPDQLHPSKAGHDLYYEIVAPVMGAEIEDALAQD